MVKWPPALRRIVGGSSSILVTSRRDGVATFRCEGNSTRFVKVGPVLDVGDLRFSPLAEADRLVWLAEMGVPAPVLVDRGTGGGMAWLVTEAVRGVTASSQRWSRGQRRILVAQIAEAVARLHALNPAACPFDGSLAVTLSWARQAVAEGFVDEEDLAPEHKGLTSEDLWERLAALESPPETDLVVCHGDLTLDNVVVNPNTLEVMAFLDVDRLGTADRWRDLAVIVRNLSGEQRVWGNGHAEEFLAEYGTVPDPQRNRFYHLLDEFY